MVFTGLAFYLAFISIKIGKPFLANLYLYVVLLFGQYLEIYFNNFFEVACKNEKISNQDSCFYAFQNWVTCPKRLKSTELNNVLQSNKII